MDPFVAQVRSLSSEKALSLAAYGESVAAYRYRTLAERATSQFHRKLFQAMADEEQGHHLAVQQMLKTYFSGCDFVLTKADKEMVVVGPRLLDIHDAASFEEALRMIVETERRTGRFYAALQDDFSPAQLRPHLKDMADECFDHADRLQAIPRP